MGFAFHFFSPLFISFHFLFSDAEVREDIPKYLIIRYFSRNCAEVVEGFAEVLGDEVGGGGGLEAFLDEAEG